MATELRYETTAGGTVTLYECEHITAGTYKLAGDNGELTVVSTGENTAVLLCVHCATHLKGMVLDTLVTTALMEILRDEAKEIAKRLLASGMPKKDKAREVEHAG